MKEEGLKGLVILFSIILSIIVFVSLVVFFSFNTMEERGQFGDMFGAINALFSALAFGGVIYAILLQRKELSLQREELQLTRNELEKSAEAQKKSALLLESQVTLMKQTKEENRIKDLADAEPLFIAKGGFRNAGHMEFKIINKGPNIRDLKIELVDPEIKLKNEIPETMFNLQELTLAVNANDSGKLNNFRIMISYKNRLQLDRIKVYEYRYPEFLNEIT